MNLSWLKYSLAFLLGATTLTVVLVLQLHRDVIRVEIHWRDEPIRSTRFSQSSSNAARRAVNMPSTTPAAAAGEQRVRDGGSLQSDISVHEQAVINSNHQEPIVLYRNARQVPDSLSGQSAVMQGTRQRTSSSRTYTIVRAPPQSVISIHEALSRTAPDWVGSLLPPVDPSNFQMKAGCINRLCVEYLSSVEKDFFEHCVKKTQAKEIDIGPIQTNVSCRFLNGTFRHPVALASFPGSGNTWMRGLLQKVTGICTGMEKITIIMVHNMHTQ